MPPFAALASQVYERTPHMLSVKWAPLVGGLVIRKKVWDKIAPEAQAVMLKAAAEAGRANKAQARAESERSIKAMQDKGLTVHPVTWTDHDRGRSAPLVAQSEVMKPRSLGLRVTRPNAHADIVLYTDGWTEVAVRRPEADAVVYETAQVDSVDAFGALLDRVIDLITWSGVPRDRRTAPDLPPLPQRAAQWVLGFDGLRMPIEP